MSTYSRVFLHIVFGTKHRTMLIPSTIAPRLHAFIGGTIRDEKGTALAIGGMPDHVHLLVAWRTDETIANLVRDIKTRSSVWLHTTFPEIRTFAWQEGYGVFSVSESQREKVATYIARQEQHHASKSFRSELVELLEAHGVSYDPRYLPHGESE
jgi:putative transposase